MTARGTDVTDSWSRTSCLVLAPHPDDETLGCGATIARKVAAGTSVHVVIVADGRHSHRSATIGPLDLASIRATEAVEACRALGLPADTLTQLGYEDAGLAEHEGEVAALLADIMGDVRPEAVLVASGNDWHPDHQALSRSARAAVESCGRPVALFEYPVWHWAEGPWLRRGPRSRPEKLRDLVADPWTSLTGRRPHLVATGEHLAAKRQALRAYRSQTTNLTGEATWAVMDEGFLAQFLGPHEIFLPTG